MKTIKNYDKQKRIFIEPDIQLNNMVKLYYEKKPYIKEKYKVPELEVRFNGKNNRFITKMDIDNVIKKLKSLDFNTINDNGVYLLRIQNEYIDGYTGKSKLSNIRIELEGINAIQSYCKYNDINKIIESVEPNYYVNFNKKLPIEIENNIKLPKISFQEFNFSVSYTMEENVSKNSNIAKDIMENWIQSKKSFRYLNRITFTKKDIPINIDISIVKSSPKNKSGFYENYTTIQEANIFNSQEHYEIELEIDNNKIGPGTKYNSYPLLIDIIKKTIKYILSGLQETNYPISYIEQNEIINDYMKLIHKDKYKPNINIRSSHFIGPSSITLQIKNIIPINENLNVPNIRENYYVTEKADGIRNLMYISNNGKIYLINMNMNIIFSGVITKNKSYYNSLLDGELIQNDKNGLFINLFAIFDIYYIHNKDIRHLQFNTSSLTDNPLDFRYPLLIQLVENIEPIGITENKNSPMKIIYKKFLCGNIERGTDIFSACNRILTDIEDGLYEYNTDGLIFTHKKLGVGSDTIGIASEPKKMTWEYSLKWKPVEYNTIDFLVTTEKNNSNQDLVKTIFQDGIDTTSNIQISQYKPCILRCGFDEKKDGYINPCQDVIDGKLPIYKDNGNEETYKPIQFYPTNPYDLDAGLVNIMLRLDENGNYQMFSEENEVFTDNTIVEFKYDYNKPGNFKWIPLRVRYDKTSELLRGMKNYGNSYKVANSNWKSIHNPITLDMIKYGKDIPQEMEDDNIYYNRITNTKYTSGLRDFHNLYVKKKLICNISKPGNILIDYACGKGGDFPKWIESKLSFVFGIDKSLDCIENRLDGACARYLNFRKECKEIPDSLFVNGNSGLNIKSGEGIVSDKASRITRAIFGNTNGIDTETLGKGVDIHIGKGKNGFDISSCQFAIHYFLENNNIFHHFMRNIAECTKLNGYFIGTGYDGETLFNKLKKYKKGEGIEIYENKTKIWQVIKDYDNEHFEDNETSIGYKVMVYQESINKLIPEYLVNITYLTRIMEDYGFKLITREEAKNHNLPEGSGMFEELYGMMMDEYKKNNSLQYKLGNAIHMNEYEKDISFLNRYFVYQKVREIDAENISRNFINKSFSEVIEEDKYVTKPKIKKLGKKIILEPDIITEDIYITINKEPIIEIEKKIRKKRTIKPKPIFLEGEQKEEELQQPLIEIEKKIRKKRTIKPKPIFVENDNDNENENEEV